MSTTDDTFLTSGENTAQTVISLIEDIGAVETMPTPDTDDLRKAHFVARPDKKTIEDFTDKIRQAAQYFKPARRKGTARFDDLDSLISWANRFSGGTSALFAKPDMSAPSITCIADYHAAGPVDVETTTGDPTARHCHHRAVYSFPLSKEWKAWMGVDGVPLDKDDLGEFIEANAKDIMDPTAAILDGKVKDKNERWENRLIETADKIEGRYGQLSQLLAMSRKFQVYETSDLTVTSNRDTGETSIQFLNEHKDADGHPLKVPNLIIIAIPVFLNGAPYRMPVRFRYRKSGGSVKFILSPYNPEKSFEAAFDEAVSTATEGTGLPMFQGTPES